MPRKPRFTLPGVPQHVIQRGNNREPCFFGEQDYRRYLDDLRAASVKYQCRVHAYVLMTNHVHLLITPLGAHHISDVMQSLGRRYVRYINATYRRTGTLWEGRYKASLVDSEAYLLTCMRYIEMNPVRAQMVGHPGEYRWSSYDRNAQGNDDPLITSHPIYEALAEDVTERSRRYREFFHGHLDLADVHQIRSALNQELVLGREDFKDKIAAVVQRQVREGQPGRPRVGEERADYFVVRNDYVY